MVREKILNEYKRRTENAIVVNTQETARIVRSNDRNCYFCHKPGYIKSKCFKYKAFIKKQAENEQGAKITRICNKNNTDTSHENKLTCFKTQPGDICDLYIDSGATCHMTNCKEYFKTFDAKTESVFLADGNKI